MPKRTDIKKILIIGAGPIVIGQACEFDYSGTQACKSLKEEGYEVVLLNSNPATIMTDPDFADRTYIEPVTPEILAKIIEKERPDAILPTLGGQTALNTAVSVAEMGILEKFGVELIGAKLPAIKKAEDRTLFKAAMEKIGLAVPNSGLAHNHAEAMGVVKKIGVDTGGSNIQFGINPRDGRLVVIEMNPRVSRSSALASKATGFPIAKIAAKLAVGYTLDEITNDITRETPACFEPTIDYVVTKIPRFTFEKFPAADATLTTQMKSVGEVMAIGRTFKESLQKALRSLEIGTCGFESRLFDVTNETRRALTPKEQQLLHDKLRTPNWERLWYMGDAFRSGLTVKEIFQLTAIDPWFLHNVRQIIEKEEA